MNHRASKSDHGASSETVVPAGRLVQLSWEQLRPSPDNPRKLFDPKPLEKLKQSIREHGVLVPLTVYKLPGQDRYGILDGERRYKCCVELAAEGIDVRIPANVVEPPDPTASLLYMFNIHQFREQWELMPTARALQAVMEKVGSDDVEELKQLTGLSEPQVERCRKILSFPMRFQELSMEPDPARRIPSNFWVELYPVLESAQEVVPDLIEDLGRDGITERLVQKYRAKRIKSVIHFRRIQEALEIAEDAEDREDVAQTLREYILDPDLETRAAFDVYIHDTRRIQKAVDASDKFIRALRRAKLEYSIEGKEDILSRLRDVAQFVTALIDKLEGSEPPEERTSTRAED